MVSDQEIEANQEQAEAEAEQAERETVAVPGYRISVTRDGQPLPWKKARPISGPKEAYALCRAYLADRDREHVMALMLDGHMRPLGWHLVSIGSLTYAPVVPREAFRAAVLLGAESVVFVHNHPLGFGRLSEPDKDLATRLIQAGALLGIHVLDLLATGEDGFESVGMLTMKDSDLLTKVRRAYGIDE